MIVHAVRTPGAGVGLSDDLVLMQLTHTANGIRDHRGVKLALCEAKWYSPFDLSPTFPLHRQNIKFRRNKVICWDERSILLISV